MEERPFVTVRLREAPWRATLVSRRCEVSGELGSLVMPGWRPQRHSLISTFDTHRLIDLEICFRRSEAVIKVNYCTFRMGRFWIWICT